MNEFYQKIFYSSQFNYEIADYNFLYFTLNKAVLKKSPFLKEINYNLITNTTKAIIKALVEHYQIEDFYQEFPNLKAVKNQQPLMYEVQISKNVFLDIEAFRKLNLKN